MPIRLIDTRRERARPIHDYGADGASCIDLAHGSGASHAYTVYFEPGGLIGPHPAGFDQVFLVAQGAGWVAGADGVRHAVDTGRSAFVPKGEVHSKGSDAGMVACMIQASEFSSAPQPAATPDADFFRALEVERTQALVARDVAAIKRLHAPDYELISPPGRVMRLERYLSLMAQGPFYDKWEHGAMRVRVSDAMAALRYHAKITFPSGKVVDLWHTDLYALQDGAWKAFWSQATQMPQEAAPPTDAQP